MPAAGWAAKFLLCHKSVNFCGGYSLCAQPVWEPVCSSETLPQQWTCANERLTSSQGLGRANKALMPQLDPCKHVPSTPGGLFCTKPVGLPPQAATTRAWAASKWPSGISVGVCYRKGVSCLNWCIKVHFSNRADQAGTKIPSFAMPAEKRMHTAKNNLCRTAPRRQGKEGNLFFADLSSSPLV